MSKTQAGTGRGQSILAFKDQEERDQLSDELLSLRFLAQVDALMAERCISKKMLAERLGTSASYVTQLFQGDKLLNIRLLTKLKRVLEVTIDISCHPLPLPAQNLQPPALGTAHPATLSLTPNTPSRQVLPVEGVPPLGRYLIFTENKENGSFSFSPDSELIVVDYGSN